MCIVPTEPPMNVTYTITSRSLDIIWSPINCSERNGFITNYTIEFRAVVERIPMTFTSVVHSENFTATELTPFTGYIFRVAGVNERGAGPFCDHSVVTDEDSKI